MLGMSSLVLDASQLRHLRAARPLHFSSSEPEDEKVPETKRHMLMRTALYFILHAAFAAKHSIGCEQFVYFNARNPRRCCAPDAFVKLDTPDTPFSTWRVWERGAPELVAEITSPSDKERWTWSQKMERFHELGAREVVFFDPDAAPGARLRVWDRLEGDLVEREIDSDVTPCVTLGLWWVVAPLEAFPTALRLARDREGADLLPSADEARRSADEARRVAERRVEELEAELRKTRLGVGNS